VRVKLKQQFIDKHFHRFTIWSPICEDLNNGEIDVIAVMKNYGTCLYLIYFVDIKNRSSLDWIEAKRFDIVDDSMPDSWINKTWSRLRPYRKKDSRFDFGFRITQYAGPECILLDSEFLFDMIENRDRAMEFYKSSIGSIPDE